MPTSRLSAYSDALYGCRFCPMCKPAGEVANLTALESHTTRARAMLLWRVVSGSATWGEREVELLYQSTLDSISEAFCINHYPVSAYVLAARAEVYEAAMAPACVCNAVERAMQQGEAVQAPTILLGAETLEAGNTAALEPALRLLHQLCGPIQPLLVPDGALPYVLGAQAQAQVQARHVADLIERSGAGLVVADGPRTLWALERVYPALGVSLPAGLRVLSIVDCLWNALERRELRLPSHAGQQVFFHQSRSAVLLADRLAQAEAIQPGYRGAEDTLGVGKVFESPRALLDAMGTERIYAVWSRSLCKSCGADDGLWLTYPHLAAGLARVRLDEVRRLGADMIVTDSPLCARHLAGAAEAGLAVRWLPELLAT